MIRFKQLYTSARDCIARLVPFHHQQQHSTRADFYQQSHQSFSSVRSFSVYGATPTLPPRSSNRTSNVQPNPAPIPLTIVRRVPATVSIEEHAAHVCKFSYGSGLIVYVNGVLTGAAYVALKVNIATLELVRRLPLDEMNAIGVCLSAAFGNEAEAVDISWAEIGSDTEQEWRDAERSWIRFSGGPYEVYEMEEHSDDSALQSSLHRFEEMERSRFGRSGSSYVAEWVACREDHVSLSSQGSSYLEDSSLSLSRPSSQVPAVTVAAGIFDTHSDYSGSLENEHMDLTAVELKAILRAERAPKTPSSSTSGHAIELKAIPRPSSISDKENIRGSWSPGNGTGPTMSSEEFDALPDYSDVEDDTDLV
jgi:hypothetical protein